MVNIRERGTVKRMEERNKRVEREKEWTLEKEGLRKKRTSWNDDGIKKKEQRRNEELCME